MIIKYINIIKTIKIIDNIDNIYYDGTVLNRINFIIIKVNRSE
jgi:hypothetical protein